MTSGAGVPIATVPALLARAEASDPGRPRLTWYGAGGERVELSARVLANWVAKTANLLVEELLDPVVQGPRAGGAAAGGAAAGGAAAGGVGAPVAAVAVDLPVHWRSVVWGLAAWSVGARVATADEQVAVVVTADPAGAPATAPGGAPLVVVTLAALAFAGDDVPAGALDYNAVVAGYGDQMPVGVEPLPVDVVPLGSPVGAPAGAAAPRVLVEAGPSPAPSALERALGTVVAALAADGSVVLRGEGAPEAGHLAEVERVTMLGS